MQLLITFAHDDKVLSLDVSPDMSLNDLVANIEAESDVPRSQQMLVFNGVPLLKLERTIAESGIKSGDLLLVTPPPAQATQTAQHSSQPFSQAQAQQAQQAQSGVAGPSGASAHDQAALERFYEHVEKMRKDLLTNELFRTGVANQYPQLIEHMNDPIKFRETAIQVERERRSAEEEYNQQLKVLNDDPYNEESQRKILEHIYNDAVNENLNSALENTPEVFGTINMLFVELFVNGKKLKAFVDSGAQSTIMSPDCMERCNLSHLLDRRFQGLAVGVGTAKILGKIHAVPIKVGTAFLSCAFTVTEGMSVDILLGLDMLKRFQACIDLRRNVLVFGDSEVPFLPDSEIDQQVAAPMPVPQSADGSGMSSRGVGSAPGVAASARASDAGQSSSSRIAQAQPPPTAASGEFSEDVIKHLCGLGDFSRGEVIDALRKSGGNPELAGALLFGVE